ncbi:hypothetical protein WICPIJ_000890 [Wickerhamomyces pijperi]|uniref:Uncharacterized protein n=1 Tax=Wickerhamomyces pijperi TaxID=599730 RepID=A0A9P8QFD0_WICPI|nr:hypothetical protein WICPIJ_000890 [Wickerhamomyces pijperi]
MVLKTYDVSNIEAITTEPLTPESFSKFGDIISADHQIQDNDSSSANYGTAIKIHKVSRITNNFQDAPSKSTATANFNIFRCSPPNHLMKKVDSKLVYSSKVLERHPFSSQAFIPMGCDKSKCAYVVICAESGEGTWHAPMISLVENLDFAVMIHENGVAEEDCQECYFEPNFVINIE